ncbi:RNA-guided endonuclease TnpB family protein, partial [Blautia wexlerae]|uniref:RNA-guided endonuclease TnpB family protein n=1 Tax=Blautia wexlerae TaxID=418240 RepID=UPI00136D09EA|nr:helix-turn-helix domain-containing protein [Blautia wexlerae]
MRKINRAVKIRIYPNKEQITQIEKTIGCSRFLYNRMLADKIRHYQEEKKMLKNTPAGYKKEYPWLKEIDSLALANVQLNLEGAFRKFFREPGVGFPHYKSKKHSRKSYTTNMVNGNICLQDRFLKLPKMQPVKIKLHRMIPEGWKLKSVTVSREPSGKYFASLLFDCENQTAEKRQATPAGYKKEYPWLKEVDSLALANVQLNLEGAFRKFFREPGVGFPHYKSKKHSRKSYTTNMVNGNICLQDGFLKLPKMQPVKIKLHRIIPEGWKLKSVTMSREPSGKYFASLLFDCENQTVEKRQAEKFLGIDFAMHGMCVFSTGERAGYPMFYRNA